MKEIKKITYDSPLYKETLALRDRILRQPLGLQFTPAELEKDMYDTHFCLLVDGKVAACLILTETENRRMKMRQVAVDTPKQGTGLGRELSEAAEKYARDKGFNTMFCHARKTAAPFYLSMGYVIKGGEFTEVNIPHYLMEKTLSV